MTIPSFLSLANISEQLLEQKTRFLAWLKFRCEIDMIQL